MAGAQGLSKGQGVLMAIASWVSQPGNQAMLDHFLTLQSQKYNKPRVEIRSKVFGASKKSGRIKRKNLEPNKE